MPTKPVRPVVKLATVLTFVFCIAAGWLIQRGRHDVIPIPDEKAAAAALLAQKLSGPRYFQLPAASGPNALAPGGEIRISAEQARAQIDRVARERNLSTEQAKTLADLIDRLVEPPTSRMVGDSTVNLLRLNLALDELQ